jgi:valyl-tRNA synthetase
MKFNNEKEIYSFWQKENFFSFNPGTSKKVYSLLMPPPNLTGELHLGHALQHSIMDAVARYKRLQEFEVLLLPGVDHAGIQFEGTLDKKLSKEGETKKSLGREKWLSEAWKFKDEIYKSFHQTWTMFGISADWSREVFTLDEGPRKAVFEQFKTFWDKGLIYKGPYIVQWCPKCNTAIEDVEMEYLEKKEKLYYVRYKVEDSDNEYIEVATTRPETIFADTAIATYPNHKIFKNLVGKKVINPLTGKLIPVIEDRRVEKDFGTGALKITPAHDILDYEIGRDNHLVVLQAVDKNGRLTEICGEFSGLRVAEAKEKVVEKLKKIGALVKEEDYLHSVAVCERCKSIVEPLISEEWFIKMQNIAKEAVSIINKDQINFLPKTYKKIVLDWIENLHDWCISRSLWWGHRIPVWYLDGKQMVSLESPGKGWVQDEQVLDTWFSSGLWPMSTLGWPDEGFKTNKAFPWSFEISAPEIKYLWIARMIMLSVYFTGKVPFETMFFHGMLRDLEGRKFSKSLGNGIDPKYLVDKWGVDATRMALYTYSIPGRDGRVNKAILDERGKNFRNFGTKLRNIARFILELAPEKIPAEQKMNDDDFAILAGLDKTIKQVTKNLDNLELHLAVDQLYEFVWHSFADKYIESTKERRVDAQPTLENVLKQVLILLHPFMPFLTEEVYQIFDVKKKSIMLENWPSTSKI